MTTILSAVEAASAFVEPRGGRRLTKGHASCQTGTMLGAAVDRAASDCRGRLTHRDMRRT